jgi:hypothetical protein
MQISVRREYTLFGAINWGIRVRERLAMSVDLLTNAMVLIGVIPRFDCSHGIKFEMRGCTGVNRYLSSALVLWLRSKRRGGTRHQSTAQKLNCRFLAPKSKDSNVLGRIPAALSVLWLLGVSHSTPLDSFLEGEFDLS